MTIHIGITGTRKGCTEGQYEDLIKFFRGRPADADVHFHHGDCVGVDAEAFALATRYGIPTVSHPPTDPKLRAYTASTLTLEPKPYMERNQDIVDSVRALVVVPEGPEADHPRSGTWATYRMAVKAGVETVVIMP